jgi:hypothetical protein
MRKKLLSGLVLAAAVAPKALVGLGIVALLGAAPAVQTYAWWKTAAWVGGGIIALLVLVFILSRGLKSNKDEGDGPIL